MRTKETNGNLVSAALKKNKLVEFVRNKKDALCAEVKNIH
jgi:hypothetical protein